MNHNQFDAISRKAIGRLPGWVHDALEKVEVLVVDEPDVEHDPEGSG